MTADEGIVEHAVDDKRLDRGDECYSYRLNAAQHREQYRRYGVNEIGKADERKVLRTRRDNGVGAAEQPYHLTRQKREHGKKHRARAESDEHCALGELPNGRCSPLTPVLTRNGDERIANREHDLLKNELYLICGGNAGERGLAVRAYHDVVGEVDRENDHILQDQRPHKTYKAAIKATVAGKQLHFT